MRGLIIAPGLDAFVSEFALRELAPAHVAFLTTEATLPTVNHLARGMASYRIFFIKNIFSTDETIQEFLNALHWLKESCGVTQVIVEATNCITVVEMATYVCASMLDLFREVLGERTTFQLVYVHSEYEIRDGVGREVRGSERLIELERPTESLSFVLLFDAVRSFNEGRYDTAKESFQALTRSTKGERCVLYGGLALLAHGYDLWDKMRISEAREALSNAIVGIDKARSFSVAGELREQVQRNIMALTRLEQLEQTSVVIDLYENAMRRERAKSYDDALARLYACIERMTQHRLSRYKIDTKNPVYDPLPIEVIEKFTKQAGTRPIELELKNGMLLLTILEDELGAVVREMTYRSFVGLIGMRNTSILAHGVKPVGEENYEKFKRVLTTPLLTTFCRLSSIDAAMRDDHKHLTIPNAHELLYQRTPNVRLS